MKTTVRTLFSFDVDVEGELVKTSCISKWVSLQYG